MDVTLSPAFASGTLKYSADVTVAQVTVAPTASDADATVAYLDGNGVAIADADEGADGLQVHLVAGSNTVKVAVSKDSLTTTYAVNLFRLVTQQLTADATKEFNLHADNGHATGIWSNGTTIWVADDDDDKLYAYALDGGARQTSKEFNLHSDNANPWGIWSDGTTIWVSDSSDRNLYAYALNGGARQTSQEFNLHSGNDRPTGIWSNGTTMWVTDYTDNKLYAYALDGGARQTSQEFNLHSDNAHPRGIWSVDPTIWVVDSSDEFIYAYALDGGARDTDFDIDLSSGNTTPWGIWSDYTTIWVPQRQIVLPKLFAYDLPPADCPGQFVSSTEYVARPTGCPRLTLLDFGDVKVEWDAVPGAVHYTSRYFMDIDDDPKWRPTTEQYPGVEVDRSGTQVTLSNLPREANVVYFSFASIDSDFSGSDWSPYSMIWINDPLELEGAAPAPDDVLTQTPASGTPGKPSFLSARPYQSNGGRASLDWPTPSGTPTGYQVLVEYSSGEGVNRLIITKGDGSSYRHATLREGTRRTFRVRGVNANGAGAWSDPTVFVADREDDSYPHMPKGFTAYAPDKSAKPVEMSWQEPDDGDGVTGYRIVRVTCGTMMDHRGFPDFVPGCHTTVRKQRDNIETEYTQNTYSSNKDYRYAVQWIKAGANAAEDVYSALSFIYRVTTKP